MSIARTNTHNTMGVRRALSGPNPRYYKSSRPRLTGYVALAGVLGTAPDPDTLTSLQLAGYDPLVLNQLVAQGATDEQLLALPYGPGTTSDDMGAGVYALQAQLGAAPASAGVPASQMQTSAVGAWYGSAVQTGNLATAVAKTTPPGIAYSMITDPTSSPLSVISNTAAGTYQAPQPTPPPPPAAPQTIEQWIMANGMWIVIILGGAIVLPPLIKKL